MGKVNIMLDLENEEILTKQVINSIQGVVKSITREYFHKTIEECVSSIVSSETAKWHSNYQAKDYVNSLIVKEFDKHLRLEINSITIDKELIKQKVDEALSSIDEKVESVVESCFDRYMTQRNQSINSLIETKIEERINEMIPPTLITVLLNMMQNTINKKEEEV